MNPTIFLDFDGVLNSEDWLKAHPEIFDPFTFVDRRAVYRLNSLLNQTDAGVVVSSTWRMYKTLSELQGILWFYGLDQLNRQRVVDTTTLGIRRVTGLNRGEEIREYLDRHPEITNYVILDDDNHGMETHGDRFIWINANRGFSDDHLKRALLILAGV